MIPSGRVYGAALNFRGDLVALGAAVHGEPYKTPPEAPVLYLKPRNTWSSPGAVVAIPPDVSHLRMGGTLGLVFARTSTKVRPADALEHVGAYTVVNDISIPHASVFRPALKEKCRDGFCPLGVQMPFLRDPDDVAIRIFVNGALAAENSTRNLVRSCSRLIADITDFMSFYPGDVLLVGEPENAPLAGPGDVVRVDVEGVGALENSIA